jgi:hypothetical protein
MNESQAIEFVARMSEVDKLRVYMDYFVDHLCLKYADEYYIRNPKTLFYWHKTKEEFCSSDNIVRHDVGENWAANGFASKLWVNFNRPSIYHYVLHNKLPTLAFLIKPKKK